MVFDDGHDTGLYSWDYLHQLCKEQETLWQRYLERMAAAGANRDPQVQVIQFQP
ncbi:MAG: gamma-butyrobetaine hydroxylase-like domain-containing protein [Haliea sp.]